MKQRFLLKMVLVAAGLFMGLNGAWADSTLIYERGISTAWSNADLTDWVLDGTAESSITDSGLKFAKTASARTEYTYTKSLSTSDNAIVSLDLAWFVESANGSATAGCYFKLGDVTLFWCGQNRDLKITIGGTETTLISGGATSLRGTTFNVSLSINKATKAVSYSISNAGYNSGTAIVGNGTVSSSDITSIIFGWWRGGQQNVSSQIIRSISISEEVQDVSNADYTINYIYNSETIKTVNGNIAIGATVSAENPITISDVKYFAKDGETTSMEIVNGTNVLNVNLRLAETWGYTVRAVDASSNVLNANIKSGTVEEGESVTVFYPRYIHFGTTLYASGSGTVTYSTTFTPTADNFVKDITYNSGTVNNVVFYTEAEDVEGVSQGANTRASMGKMGYTGGADTYADVTTVAPGKYVLYMRAQNGNKDARNFNFKVDEDVIFTGSFPQGTNGDYHSEEFTVNASSTLSFASEGSSASGIDYIYLVKTAEIATITDVDYATFVPSIKVAVPDGVKAYYVTNINANGKARMESVPVIPANKPVILFKEVSENTEVVTFEPTDAAEVSLSNILEYSNTAFEADGTQYILAEDGGVVGFYKAKNTIPARKAYLVSPVGANFLSFCFDDETTGIEKVENAAVNANGTMFNLAGQRVAQPTKGLYIVNGKKVVIK